MAYTQIVRSLQWKLKQTTTRYMLHSCKLRTGLPDHMLASAAPIFRSFPSPVYVLAARSFSVNFSNRCQKLKPKDSDVTVSRYGSPNTSTGQKVKEAGRDFTYLIVVLVGLGVTGGLLFVVFQELFSSSSPNKIYGKAFDRVKSHPEVIGAFGEPIKCYGETTRRGRRQQVSHMMYQKEGIKYMRLKFYIEGSEPAMKGTVHSESKENPDNGKFEFRYIFVDVDTYPRRTIIVEDNR